MSFSESLKQHRIKAGYSSAKEFAARLGLSYSTYVAYENTDREPRFDVLIKIADILNVSIDELLERNVNESLLLKTWFESNGFKLLHILTRSSDNKTFYSISESFRVYHVHPSPVSFFVSEDDIKSIYNIATQVIEKDVHNLVVKLLHEKQRGVVADTMMKLFHSPECKAIRDELLSENPFFFSSYSAAASKKLQLTEKDTEIVGEVLSRCYSIPK